MSFLVKNTSSSQWGFYPLNWLKEHGILLFVLPVLLILVSFKPLYNHIELLATCTVQEHDKTYFIKVNLKKDDLHLVLKEGAKCSPSEMISKCGTEYLQKHIGLKVNEQRLELQLESLDVQKDYIDFVFKTKKVNEKLKSISVESDYFFEYNDHGIIRVILELDDTSKSYTLKPNRTSITHYSH